MRALGLFALALVLQACGGGDGGEGDDGKGGGGGRGGSGGTSSEPTLRFAASSQVVAEGERVSVELTLEPAGDERVTGEFTVDGSATFPEDHDLEPGAFAFEAGETSVTLELEIVDDLEVEQDEELLIEVRNVEGAGNPGSHQIVIADDDVPGTTLSIEGPDPSSIEESFETLTFALVLSEPAPVDVGVTLDVSGTAAALDHDLDVTDMTIAAGETRVEMDFQIFDDVFDEDDETIELTIADAPNANIDAQNGFVLTIEDDDPLPVVNVLDATQVVSEGQSGWFYVRVGLSAPSGRGVAIPYAVRGTAREMSDYTRDEFVHVNPLESINGASSDIFLVVDDVPEVDETIVIMLEVPEFAVLGDFTTHTITIVDDDTPGATATNPTVVFDFASDRVLEGTLGLSYPVLLSAFPESALSVPFTVGGTATTADHDLVVGSAEFSSAERLQSIAFDTTDNDAIDGDRNVVVTLGSPTGGTLGMPNELFVTIQDDDRSPILFEFVGGDSFAGSIAGLGDVTGDMVPDFAAAEVWNGNATVYSGADFSELFTVPGQRVASAGDWDDDGVLDIAIGDRRFQNASGDSIGKLTIYEAGGDVLDEFEGPNADALFADTLGGGCDLDGDDRPEVIVGAPNFGNEIEDLGAIFVYSSAERGLLRTHLGNVEGDNLGSNVAGCAGDFDGDGVEDLIGDIQQSVAVQTFPTIHIYSGATGEALFLHTRRNSHRFSMTSLGDFDVDGTIDYAFSHLERDCMGPRCQHLELRGARSLELLFDVPVTTADIDIGNAPDAIAAADFDGDGQQDLLVAAPGYDGLAGENTGQLFVYSGATHELLFVFQSPVAGRSVSRVARIGDLTGDGADEILVGAYGGLSEPGAIYVLSNDP